MNVSHKRIRKMYIVLPVLTVSFPCSSPGVSQSLSATSWPAAPRHQPIGPHPRQPARLGLWRPRTGAAPVQQPAVLQHFLHCLRLFPGASFVHNRASGFSYGSPSLQSGVFLQLHAEPAVWQAQLLQRLGHLRPLCGWGGKHQRYAVLKLRQHRPGTVLSLQSRNTGERTSFQMFLQWYIKHLVFKAFSRNDLAFRWYKADFVHFHHMLIPYFCH